MIERNVNFSWRILLILIYVALVFSGCSGKSSPIEPSENSLGNEEGSEPGITHGVNWITPDDMIKDDGEDNEKNVDITNVVYGHDDPYGLAGQIKKPGYPPGDDYTCTVVAWAEAEGTGERNIYFQLIYRLGEIEGKGPIKKVLNFGGTIQAWPAITAHYWTDGRIVVDIAFQKRLDQNSPWEIWHARCVETAPQSHDFNTNWVPAPLTPGTLLSCRHPDIVFDAAPDIQGFTYERIHVVYEYGSIYYTVMYMRGRDMQAFIVWEIPMPLYPSSVNTSDERPRIDVGFDNSGLYPFPGDYLVGIVWHRLELTGVEGLANVLLCGFPADQSPIHPQTMFITPPPDLPVEYTHCMFPCIEIEPIENTAGAGRSTFVIYNALAGISTPGCKKIMIGVSTHKLAETYPDIPAYGMDFYH